MPTTTAGLDGSELPQATTLLGLFSQLVTALVASATTVLIAARVPGLDVGGLDTGDTGGQGHGPIMPPPLKPDHPPPGLSRGSGVRLSGLRY